MEEDCAELDGLRAAVEEDPENPAKWYAYGRVLLDRARGKEALEALQKALELAPDAPAIRFCLGCALAMVGKHNDAVSQFRAVVGDDPELDDPLSALGLSAVMCMADSQGALGNWKEAVETVRPTVNMAIDILSHVAGFLQKAGEHELAIGFSSICLLLTPDNPELLHAIGYNKMKLGRLEEALDDLRHALKLDPQTPDIWYDYGITLARMNQRREARPIFRKVLRLDHRYFRAYYDLACLDALEENRDAAFRNLNRAVDCGWCSHCCRRLQVLFRAYRRCPPRREQAETPVRILLSDRRLLENASARTRGTPSVRRVSAGKPGIGCSP